MMVVAAVRKFSHGQQKSQRNNNSSNNNSSSPAKKLQNVDPDMIHVCAMLEMLEKELHTRTSPVQQYV